MVECRKCGEYVPENVYTFHEVECDSNLDLCFEMQPSRDVFNALSEDINTKVHNLILST